MAKKTFFEKLTGASWDEKEGAEEEVKTESEVETETEEETESKVETEPEEEKETKPKKEKPAKKETDEEEPLNESEGQLTIDVYQNSNEVVIKSTIAGVEPNGIDINITSDMITIKGNRQKDEDIKEEDYYYQECYWGPFSRSVILPVDVESENAKATMKNGILTIKLPKVERVKMKKIEIQPE